MAEAKTGPTGVAVDEFLAQIEDPRKRADSQVLIELMQRVTGHPPKMWGSSIVGFGTYHYKYDSGHEGDSCLAGFSPRKAEFSIYLNGTHEPEIAARRDALLERLGQHRMGKGCLYVKWLEGLDMDVLEQLVRLSHAAVRERYPARQA
ncbi:MAG: DUF1801 domain-containing protein [Devosia nanyangense]|uniref:DUF1801 domain-containing protein n=1 Tax=Devosia nanyangense TaxID=1228055 RepID=A0A933L1W6_9HYPH|nr:DUF1801 domain-containing protein [Devosia nanyangense]